MPPSMPCAKGVPTVDDALKCLQRAAIDCFEDPASPPVIHNSCTRRADHLGSLGKLLQDALAPPWWRQPMRAALSFARFINLLADGTYRLRTLQECSAAAA